MGARHGDSASGGAVRLPIHPDHLLRDLPIPTPREAIAAAARRLVELRDGWLNPPGLEPDELAKRTLTNLYNARPTWLAQAHERLDAAVFAAYGWPSDLLDDDILARLLELNLAREAAPREDKPIRMVTEKEGSG
jgi:hypothetical protein